MQKYEVRLASPVDKQSRVVTLSDTSESLAVARVMAAEVEACAYDFASDPYLTDAARKAIEGGYEIDRDGKVRPTGSANNRFHRAKFHQQRQAEPYEIVEVRAVPIDTDRLLRELASLQHDEKAWNRLLKDLARQGIPLNAVTAYLYGVPMKNQLDGTAVSDWDTDTIKCSLHTSTYTGNQDTDDFFNDATNEITGTGYTAGGATLASKTATYDTASDQARLDAADTTWTTSTLTARCAVVYKSTGTGTTSPLIARVDFGADVSTTAGTFQITWDSTGIAVYDVT